MHEQKFNVVGQWSGFVGLPYHFSPINIDQGVAKIFDALPRDIYTSRGQNLWNCQKYAQDQFKSTDHSFLSCDTRPGCTAPPRSDWNLWFVQKKQRAPSAGNDTRLLQADLATILPNPRELDRNIWAWRYNKALQQNNRRHAWEAKTTNQILKNNGIFCHSAINIRHCVTET